MKLASFYCCKECTKRYVGCHSECQEYKELKEENTKRFWENVKTAQDSNQVYFKKRCAELKSPLWKSKKRYR